MLVDIKLLRNKSEIRSYEFYMMITNPNIKNNNQRLLPISWLEANKLEELGLKCEELK